MFHPCGSSTNVLRLWSRTCFWKPVCRQSAFRLNFPNIYRSFGPNDIAFRELSRVRALGVRLAIDDFGAGFASLERLRVYPIDQIKLDRAFVAHLGENMRADEILYAILALSRALNITCCAKGVETEHQMALLDANGCEEVQGYLLGAPVRDSRPPHPAST